jgi:hypothetical protein
MRNINKLIGVSIKPSKSVKKNSDWLRFDAVEVIPKKLKDSVNSSDYGKIAQAKIDKINELLRTQGYKINESIDDDTLQEQITFVQNYRDSEARKLENTLKKKIDWVKSATILGGNPFTIEYQGLSNAQIQHAHEQEIMADSLNFVLEAMKKELSLRNDVNAKIDSAKKQNTAKFWDSLKNSWRTIEQKNIIEENIKISKEAERIANEKQAKLDQLNKQLANAKTPKEKDAIAAQISSLLGSVSTQTGVPKGLIYVGIGMAVIVGVWITIRAIRK